MPNTPDPRDTCSQITDAVSRLMVVVGYITAVDAMGDDGELELIARPTHAAPFSIPGTPSRDAAYVANRLAETKDAAIDAVLALADALKAQVEALR